MQPQQPNQDPSGRKPPLHKNPLLSAAASGYPFENFAANTLLVPVTPATPAILQDEPPPAQLDAFVGQQLPPIPRPHPPPGLYNLSPAAPQFQQFNPSSQEVTPPSQKQGGSYITSILSSLPTLITGDNNYSQPQAPPVSTGYPQPHGFPPGPPTSSGTNFQGYSTQPPVNQPPPPPKASGYPAYPPAPGPLNPPPTTVTPTAPPPKVGEPASYRLGHQRRLKYIAPPDIAAASPKPPTIFQPSVPSYPSQQPGPISTPNFYNPLSEVPSNNFPPAPYQNPAFPGTVTPPTPPLFYNPGTNTPAIYSPSAPPVSQNSSQGSSIPNSFRSSPIQQASPPSRVSAYGNHLSSSYSTPPQAISHTVPTTPQNTPADPGFASYRATAIRQPELLEAIQEKIVEQEIKQAEKKVNGKPERTFTPISAATVTEKLEHLIASQQSEDDASSEVANLTEELSEIDLTRSSRDDEPPNPPPISDQFDLPEPITLPEPVHTASYFAKSVEVHKPPETNTFASKYYNDPPPRKSENSLGLAKPQEFSERPSLYQSLPETGRQENRTSVYGSQQDEEQQQPQQPQQQQQQHQQQQQLQQQQQQQQQQLQQQQQQQQQQLQQQQQQQQQQLQQQQQEQQQQQQQQQHQQQTEPAFFDPTRLPNPPCQQKRQPDQYHVEQETAQAMPEPSSQNTEHIHAMMSSSSRSSLETVPQSLENLATAGVPEKQMQYRPVYNHWFYRKDVESAKFLWLPFSMHDSLSLEDVHNSPEIAPDTTVATDGGRYDVEILKRQRSPVYWSGPVAEVRRCSWFFKGATESRYTPYEEKVAARLEEDFKQACTMNLWNRRVDLNNGEYIVFHSPTVQLHYPQATTPEISASWGNNAGLEDNGYSQGLTSRPKMVKRGMDEFNIEDGEPEKVDHLLFLVHGIGSVCDLKFRSVEEVVDDFRSISLQLVHSHYRNSCDRGIVNRIEVLPISWHAALHSGIDKKLETITLESIPKLRNFTNDTLLDILFYTSPVYCQTIMQTVGGEMNKLYNLFRKRNPDFGGNVYVGGHSLGSLIMFDLLCNQKPKSPDVAREIEIVNENEGVSKETSEQEQKKINALVKRKLSRKVTQYVMGNAGTGQPFINYPQLAFNPGAFFALGSPIGMFVTVRGIDTLGEDFVFPTCPAFFNIFHPFDPVAYRVEALVTPDAHKHRPMLIPHHKGRKRMHLELKETMARVGADLKQKLLDSVRSTWNSVYQLAMFHKPDNQALEQEIHKVVEEQLTKPPSDPMQLFDEDAGADFKVGNLNKGRRIDYVLQEAPFEYINEYIFAMTSHVCYWESEDTMLMILKEIYSSSGIQTDTQFSTQPSMSMDKMSMAGSSVTSPVSLQSPSFSGLDPASPIGPPPTTGFIKKS